MYIPELIALLEAKSTGTKVTMVADRGACVLGRALHTTGIGAGIGLRAACLHIAPNALICFR